MECYRLAYMKQNNLSHINTWIFDLDNTLYDPKYNLFGQIDVRMGEYIQNIMTVDAPEARRIQKHYFQEHGTTLRGLMAHQGIEPRHFLDYVHDIDVTVLPPDLELAQQLADLPGRKLVFTNGDEPYARRVMNQLQISAAFEAVHCIIAMDYLPKPDARAYAGLLSAHAVDPARSIFFEDMARNLSPAKALGMTTVWLDNGSEWGDRDALPDHIDIKIPGLQPWLKQTVEHLKAHT